LINLSAVKIPVIKESHDGSQIIPSVGGFKKKPENKNYRITVHP
jgi:hypothetical protein